MQKTESPWLTKEEAAKRARVSPRMLDLPIATGALRSRLIGRRRIFHVDWIDAWLDGEEEKAS